MPRSSGDGRSDGDNGIPLSGTRSERPADERASREPRSARPSRAHNPRSRHRPQRSFPCPQASASEGCLDRRSHRRAGQGPPLRSGASECRSLLEVYAIRPTPTASTREAGSRGSRSFGTRPGERGESGRAGRRLGQRDDGSPRRAGDSGGSPRGARSGSSTAINCKTSATEGGSRQAARFISDPNVFLIGPWPRRRAPHLPGPPLPPHSHPSGRGGRPGE